jgi:hypothetical protein
VTSTDEIIIDNDGTVDSVANSLISNPQPEDEAADLEEPEAIEDSEEALEDPETDESDETDEEVEDQDEEQDHEEADQEELYAVKVNGEQREVTLNDLKQSYSGQAYIQKGMQDAAAQKKQAEEVYHALLQEREQMSQLLNQLQSGEMLKAPVPPDSQLVKTDPIGYMEKKVEYDAAKIDFDNQQQVIAEAQIQQAQRMQFAQQANLQQEMGRLAQVIPEFADPEKGGKLKEDLVSYGTRLGYSEAELGGVTDHRAIVVLHKAKLWDDLQGSKGKAKQKVSNARPVVKPGAKKSSRATSQKRSQEVQARMKKTGNVDDIAAFLLS